MKKISLLVFLTLINSIFAGNRALVIGNSYYGLELGRLINPINDAVDISHTLRDIGFDVTVITNGNKEEILRAVNKFKESLNDGDTALFYYTGHGLQYQEKNYIVPIGAKLDKIEDLNLQGIEVSYILSSLKNSKSEKNIYILDACRKNRLKEDNLLKGLARKEISQPESVLIYSAYPDQVAKDGVGRNSLFAKSIINNIKTPNLTLDALYSKIVKEIGVRVSGQKPWVTSTLTNEFYFVRDKLEPLKDLYGSLLVEAEESGDLYIDNKRIYSLNKGESKMISKLVTGNYFLEFVSNGVKEREEVVINDREVATALFKGNSPVIEVLETEEAIELTEVILAPEEPKIKEVKEDYIKSIGKATLDMVYIEAETFSMGSAEGYGHEEPVHSVELPEDFYIGRYEVSQNLYKEVMGINPSSFKGDNLPVETVSWFDAIEFCNRLSEKEGLKPVYRTYGGRILINKDSMGYRLPTEAQWEYAARGGNRSKGYKYSGSNKVEDVAWFDNNSGRKTHDIGIKGANELGIYDMSGNVWEWCWDWYGRYNSDISSGYSKVGRGGSWSHYYNGPRVSYRTSYSPDIKDYSVGFRIVKPALYK